MLLTQVQRLSAPPPTHKLQMTLQSLLRQHHPLSDPEEQRRVLRQALVPPFENALLEGGASPLTAGAAQVLQLNLGRVCNQTCRHCHVDAGPDRRESMSSETVQQCLDALARSRFRTVDVTGGAPEMHPDFRRIVVESRRLGCQVIDRCNLTILTVPRYHDLPEFLADQGVEIVASLPCYLEQNVDAQRGDGVFEQSLTALRRLNDLGYGRDGTGLRLTLVYNPLGPSLPPPQQALEEDYRRELRARYGIEFNSLYTITNMPISRFLDDLIRADRFEEYLQRLVAAFNPATVDGLMCRSTVSVDWEGRLYDCDFNQMLSLGLAPNAPQHIRDFDAQKLMGRRINVGNHCYGCTAGQGSSCTGVVQLELPAAEGADPKK